MLGELCITTIAIALALIAGEVLRVVLVERPLGGAPMDGSDEIVFARGHLLAGLLGGLGARFAPAGCVLEGR